MVLVWPYGLIKTMTRLSNETIFSRFFSLVLERAKMYSGKMEISVTMEFNHYLSKYKL